MGRLRIAVVLLLVIIAYLILEPAASFLWGRVVGYRTVESFQGEVGLRALHLLPALILSIVGAVIIAAIAPAAWASTVFAIFVGLHRFFSYRGIVGTLNIHYLALTTAESFVIAGLVLGAYAYARRIRRRGGPVSVS